ncbi:MAG: amidohydrolase [Acidobacteria bacterium]|nr:amidohydrolase [Acidobacteriota bacterium]
MSLLIKNAVHCFTRESCDVFIEAGKIKRIATSIEEEADKTIQASGKILYPAFANMHTHAGMTLFRGFADDMPLMEWLEKKIWPIEYTFTEEDVYAGTRLAILEMIKTGTTLFNDMYWHFDAAWQAVEEMGVRAVLSAVMIDMFDAERQKANEKRTKAVFDRYFGKNGRIRLALGPHAIYTVSEAGLRFAGEMASQYNTYIHIHLSETLDEVEESLKKYGKRPPQCLDEAGLLTDKSFLAHLVWLNYADMDLLAERNCIGVASPVSNMKLSVGGVMPMKDLMERGIRIALGTDGAASNNNLDMVDEMKTAALLQKWRNDSADMPDADGILQIATEGFRILGIPVGKLKEGDAADLILLKSHPIITPLHNPVSNLVYAASGTLVDTTVCNGQVLMEDGYVPGEEEILADVKKTVKKHFDSFS